MLCFAQHSYGKISLVWDGDVVQTAASGSFKLLLPAEDLDDSFGTTTCRDRSAIPRQASATLSLENNEPGHLLDLVFEPNQADGQLKLMSLVLRMSEGFANCEDSKACLRELGNSGPEGLELRSSNQLQLECLEGRMEDYQACQKWLSCLQTTVADEDHRTRLILLLHAASIGQSVNHTPELIQKDADAVCFYPPNQDPESWDCDCYSKMIERCSSISSSISNYSDLVCTRANICLHPRICTSWYASYCGESVVNEVMNALRVTSTAATSLLWRSSQREKKGVLAGKQQQQQEEGAPALSQQQHAATAGVGARNTNLDDALAGKMCS
jgi:hypothetical protein